jgi:hypothetical protein
MSSSSWQQDVRKSNGISKDREGNRLRNTEDLNGGSSKDKAELSIENSEAIGH